MPQNPERQASSEVQAPVACLATHWLVALSQLKPLAQSLDAAHVVLQLLASMQAKWPGQGAGVPAVQTPEVSQALAEVSMESKQVDAHAAAQQLPLPFAPHTPDWHCELEVQAAPGIRELPTCFEEPHATAQVTSATKARTFGRVAGGVL
jgi:hypothetical protein